MKPSMPFQILQNLSILPLCYDHIHVNKTQIECTTLLKKILKPFGAYPGHTGVWTDSSDITNTPSNIENDGGKEIHAQNQRGGGGPDHPGKSKVQLVSIGISNWTPTGQS